MHSFAKTPQEYIDSLPEDRKEALSKLREVILKNIPKGFREEMGYGMMGYVVPHELYPPGYHCDPKLPLPFLGMASQKNYISFYHMGLYKGRLLEWFQERWKSVSGKKLDMGKCCIRFKNVHDIPFDLIGELCQQMTPQEWITHYEKTFLR